jgi:hypothetical protein
LLLVMLPLLLLLLQLLLPLISFAGPFASEVLTIARLPLLRCCLLPSDATPRWLLPDLGWLPLLLLGCCSCISCCGQAGCSGTLSCCPH